MAPTKKRDITREEASSPAPSTSLRDKRQRASRSRNPNYRVDLDENDAFLETLLEESTSRVRRDTKVSVGTIFSWLIHMKILKENQKVYVAGHEGLTGAITREGIMCHCCGMIFTISEYGDHRVGFNISSKGILTSRKKVSLFSLQDEACKRLMNSSGGGCYNHIQPQDGYEDASDDSCIICSDSRDLICCSTCPSTYHQGCLNMQGELPNDWACSYCCCKYCEGADNQARMLLKCSLCQKQFHRECTSVEAKIKQDVRLSTFCGNGCHKIQMRLLNLLGVQHQIGEDKNLSWTLLRRDVLGEADDDAAVRYTKINMIQSILLNPG